MSPSPDMPILRSATPIRRSRSRREPTPVQHKSRTPTPKSKKRTPTPKAKSKTPPRRSMRIAAQKRK